MRTPGDQDITLLGLINQDPATLNAIEAANGYESYTAILVQDGTSADPTATILKNGIGNIIWERDGEGFYIGTLTGAFPIAKTWATVNASTMGAVVSNISANDDSVYLVITKQGETGDLVGADGWNAYVEIRVYN